MHLFFGSIGSFIEIASFLNSKLYIDEIDIKHRAWSLDIENALVNLSSCKINYISGIVKHWLALFNFQNNSSTLPDISIKANKIIISTDLNLRCIIKDCNCLMHCGEIIKVTLQQMNLGSHHTFFASISSHSDVYPSLLFEDKKLLIDQ